jgi:DMSO/TMAO reductase YedYZ molybdopterin-dependent catalytic subunit
LTSLTTEQRQIDLGQPAPDLLRALDKDPRLIPYGGGNFGMPLALLEPEGSLLVPTARFFVRSNGPIPRLDPATWALHLHGHVARPLSLSLEDLQALPQRELVAVLECAGNGRTRFDPLPPGTPWGNDAAGSAVWTGVPLAAVLDLAGVREGAVDLVAQGGDFPAMRRGLPLAVARDPETLLVLGMNGAPLPLAHGGPLRLLVPGWAGIASTKWLIGLEIIDHAFAGFWNTDNYVYWDGEGTALRPVTQLPVKSLISAPQSGAHLTAGPVTISGYAWSGHGAIAQVALSTDGGQRWTLATLAGTGRRGWTRFCSAWQARPGRHTILARATDERRLTQPRVAAWNGKGYGQNGIHRVEVVVEPASPNGARP